VGDSQLAAARFTGLVAFQTWPRVSPSAPPWALCCRPHRGLGKTPKT